MRIIMYVDGFNLYHAIDDLSNESLKWLDLYKLAQSFCYESQKIITVKYYSAFARWNQDTYYKHEVYVNALRAKNVECNMSSFKKKPRHCKNCNSHWFTHEEKETDVKIGVDMVADAYNNLYDGAILISADTDFIPAIKAVRKANKSVMIALPPKRNKYATGLKTNANKIVNITKERISKCRLENQVLFNGRIIKCPDDYKIK